MSLRIFIYNLISWLLAPLLAVIIFLRHLVKKRPYQLLFAPDAQSRGDYYWIQAPSAGEVILAKTLIEHLEAVLTSPNWFLITSTYSGYCTAQQIIGARAVILYFHFPLDFAFAIGRLIRRYPPLALFIVESDIRPSLVYLISRLRVKIMLINGRVNQRLAQRYQRIKFFLADSWKRFEFYSVQSAEDRDRLIAFGAPTERISITGNIKFDQQFPELTTTERQHQMKKLGLTSGCQLVVAGSTHQGEEELILDAFQLIQRQHPEAYLLIAPRNLNRVPEVEALLASRGLIYWLASQSGSAVDGRIIVLNSFGELPLIYGLATVAIIGGSFVNIGGHNILEPVGYGCPVFYGPHMQHFQEIAEGCLRAGVGFLVRDYQTLAQGCLRFMDDLRLREEVARKGQTLIRENQGAVQRTVELIVKAIKN